MKLFTHIGDVKGTDSYKKWMEMHRITGEYVFTEGKKTEKILTFIRGIFTKREVKRRLFKQCVKTLPEYHIELI
mgnify:CR=1 FL=1